MTKHSYITWDSNTCNYISSEYFLFFFCFPIPQCSILLQAAVFASIKRCLPQTTLLKRRKNNPTCLLVPSFLNAGIRFTQNAQHFSVRQTLTHLKSRNEYVGVPVFAAHSMHLLFLLHYWKRTWKMDQKYKVFSG